MKIVKILSVSLLLTVAMLNHAAAAAPVSSFRLNETPARTIIVKHPLAADANKYFSTMKILSFEIFKPGTKDDMARIVASLKNDPAVETVSEGAVTGGDYYAVTLVLKSEKSKEWFIAEFKKAGLNTIKMNNNPVIAVENL